MPVGAAELFGRDYGPSSVQLALKVGRYGNNSPCDDVRKSVRYGVDVVGSKVLVI